MQVKKVVYLNKKIEFCGGSVRCQVYEMWAQGDKVACGVVTDKTKVRMTIVQYCIMFSSLIIIEIIYDTNLQYLSKDRL